MKKEDLGNLVNRVNDPGVGHGVYATLGTVVLDKMRGGSQFTYVVHRSSSFGIERFDIWISKSDEFHQSNSSQVLIMASGVMKTSCF